MIQKSVPKNRDAFFVGSILVLFYTELLKCVKLPMGSKNKVIQNQYIVNIFYALF